MATNVRVDTLAIGITVDTKDLKRGIEDAARELSSAKLKDRAIYIDAAVRATSFNRAKRDILARIKDIQDNVDRSQQIVIKPKISVSQTSARGFVRDINRSIEQVGGFKIKVTGVSVPAPAQLRAQIEKLIGPITVTVANAQGSGPGRPPSSPPPPPRPTTPPTSGGGGAGARPATGARPSGGSTSTVSPSRTAALSPMALAGAYAGGGSFMDMPLNFGRSGTEQVPGTVGDLLRLHQENPEEAARLARLKKGQMLGADDKRSRRQAGILFGTKSGRKKDMGNIPDEQVFLAGVLDAITGDVGNARMFAEQKARSAEGARKGAETRRTNKFYRNFGIPANMISRLAKNYGMDEADFAKAVFGGSLDLGPVEGSWIEDDEGRLRRMAGGGHPRAGEPVVVGERGQELFVPQSAGWIIPNHVMSQIPHAAGGARVRGGPGSAEGMVFAAGNTLGIQRGTPMADFISNDQQWRALADQFDKMFVGSQNWNKTFTKLNNMAAKLVQQWQAAQSNPQSARAAQPGIPFNALPPNLQAQAIQQMGGMPPSTPPPGGSPKQPRVGGVDRLRRMPGTPFDTERQFLAEQVTRDFMVDRSQVHASRAARISELQSLTPVRALSVSIGQITSQLSGRREVQERAKLAANASAKAQSADEQYGQERIKLSRQIARLRELRSVQADALSENQQEELEDLPQAIKEQIGQIRQSAQVSRKYNKAADSAAEDILRRGDVTKNILAGTAGIVGGTLLFGAAFGAAQIAFQSLGEVLAKATERATGFHNVAAKVTDDLSNQTIEMHGAVATVIAQREATAGLSAASADIIDPLLKQRTAVEAGNKAIMQQIELMHASAAIARQTGGGVPPGVDRGLFQTTGGLFGTPIGGIPSTIEQVTNELRGGSVPDIGTRMAISTLPGPLGIIGGAIAGDPIAELKKNMEDTGVTVDVFNEQLKKGGSNMQIVNGKLEEQYQAIEKSGIPGAKDFAAALRGSERSIENFDQSKAAQQISQFFQAMNIGGQTPDAELLTRQLTERQIPSQRGLFEAQRRFAVGSTIPAQFALESIANPAMPVGSTYSTKGLFGKEAQANVKQYRDLAVSSQAEINKEIEAGRQAMFDIVRPAGAEAFGQFKSLLGDIEQVGQQMQSIQLGITQSQVNLQVKEYNNQIRIAKRSLADAKELVTGIKQGHSDGLGALEKQNMLISRQLQLLGFEMQQRQINFQLSIAGLQVPGLTPEEQAARVQQAKVEAGFAQKQLDLQKQLGQNQFKGQQIVNTRNLEDIRATLGLLQEGRDVTISTAAAEEALARLNKRQNQLVQKAGQYLEQGTKIANEAMSAAQAAAAATGKAFGEILNITARAWGIYGQQASAAYRQLFGSVYADRQNPDRKNPNVYASGGLFKTTGATSMVVGEAGTETVAVLSNPRGMSPANLGGGGPSFTFNIAIGDNTNMSEAQLEQWAHLIAQKMGRELGSRVSLLGLRTTF